jgi:hypothetical protein
MSIGSGKDNGRDDVEDYLSNSFNEYIDSLNAFYITYTPDTGRALMRQYQGFEIEQLDDNDLSFIKRSLRLSNHGINSLQGENVILFHEPVVISSLKIKCQKSRDGSGAVRLISYSHRDKKIIPSGGHNPFNHITSYDVHDIVVGLIISNHCSLESVKCATVSGLLTDYSKIEHARVALEKAENAPKVQAEVVSRQFDELTKEINVSKNIYDGIVDDIDAGEKEKERVEISLENSKNSLLKARRDVEEINSAYSTLLSKSEDVKVELEQIGLRLELAEKSTKAEEVKAENANKEAKIANDLLLSVKNELAEAKRESNLTTLDMVGHQSETKTQVKLYSFFALLSFSGLACMALYIYSNGEGFKSILPVLNGVSSWDVLLSRLPLITATAIILGGLSGVFGYLISHIISLNTEKMTMLKAAILAEQITDSLDTQGMTEKELLEFRRDTKIDLIMKIFSKGQVELDKNKAATEALEIIKKVKELTK